MHSTKVFRHTLSRTSVGESDIQQRIKTLLQEDEFFNQVKEGLQKNPGKIGMKDINLGLIVYCCITTDCMCLIQHI
jgi:hypothetical protein